jgi:hypothetical protein
MLCSVRYNQYMMRVNNVAEAATWCGVQSAAKSNGLDFTDRKLGRQHNVAVGTGV